MEAIAVYDTLFSAASVEWQPTDFTASQADLGTFVVGTYQLIDPSTGKFIVPLGLEANDKVEGKVDASCNEAGRGPGAGSEGWDRSHARLEVVGNFGWRRTLVGSFKKLDLGDAKLDILGQADADGQLSLYAWCPVENKGGSGSETFASPRILDHLLEEALSILYEELVHLQFKVVSPNHASSLERSSRLVIRCSVSEVNLGDGFIDAQQPLGLGLNDSRSLFAHNEEGDMENLALSLDWSNRLNESDPFIAVSFSDGTLATIKVQLQLDGTLACAPQLRWSCHTFEAWIAAVDYWHTTTLFSGGDDAKFKGWDTRMVSETCATPIWVNKSHQMGVCSIQANPHWEHIIATGSYDATLRIFDTRKLTTPIQELKVGGGVWRVKWHPTSPSTLLLAAMHDGVHIANANLDAQAEGPEITQSFKGHQSLAYGADWCPLYPSTKVASCSFYDHQLCLW
ncbi:hypothetical protein L0F63_000491 [Massospora cicadina]|nr:hypothetical protein L0F63_000491 [Massospora cicadina]